MNPALIGAIFASLNMMNNKGEGEAPKPTRALCSTCGRTMPVEEMAGADCIDCAAGDIGGWKDDAETRERRRRIDR